MPKFATPIAPFPASRPRRQRRTAFTRDLVREHHLSASDLIWPVAKLIAILSEFTTLEPGDMIATGTPSGVGAARKPPVWMRAGDVCEIVIEGIPTLRNPVAADVS